MRTEFFLSNLENKSNFELKQLKNSQFVVLTLFCWVALRASYPLWTSPVYVVFRLLTRFVDTPSSVVFSKPCSPANCFSTPSHFSKIMDDKDNVAKKPEPPVDEPVGEMNDSIKFVSILSIRSFKCLTQICLGRGTPQKAGAQFQPDGGGHCVENWRD